MGADASGGVIGTDHQVFGHPDLVVVDGSAIPANVGVNPSLTGDYLITFVGGRWSAPLAAPLLPTRA